MELAIATLMFIGYLIYSSFKGNSTDSVNDLGGFVDTSADTITVKIAEAIARAEGFYVAGSRPARNHNPGDMTADLIGRSTGKDGSFVVYANDGDGWLNLYAQINAWLNGTSHHATADSTISQIASFYTDTEQDIWANNVANYLGVDVSTPIGELA
jgi:hypothetical protein